MNGGQGIGTHPVAGRALGHCPASWLFPFRDTIVRVHNPGMEAPSPNGRTDRGRFAKGNAGGPGNPHAKRVADLRAALVEAVTPADIAAVAKALVRRAKEGEVPAIRELFDRLMGRATPPSDTDTVVALELSPEIRARAREIIARRLGVQSSSTESN